MYGVQKTVAEANRIAVGFEHDTVERIADQKDRKRNVPRQRIASRIRLRTEPSRSMPKVTVAGSGAAGDAVYFRYAPSSGKSRISERPHCFKLRGFGRGCPSAHDL